MSSILFVCLGNICRSPSAEGFLRAALVGAGASERFTLDSAGTGGWHAGEPPDPRAIRAAADVGVDLSDLRARQVRPSDFTRFDLILAMDRQNLTDLTRLAPAGSTARLLLYREAAFGEAKDVADPYYGGAADFAACADLCAKASRRLVERYAAPHAANG